MRVVLLWTLLSVAAASPPQPFLPEAAAHIRSEFERVGRRVPEQDPALARAAEALAQAAFEKGAAGAADAVGVAHQVSRQGGLDPSPRALVIKASPPERTLESLRARTDLSEEPASHFGVAVVQHGGEAVLVVLLAERKAQLDPFPRQLPEAGMARSLCGELRAPLEHPEVYVTRPSGMVDKVPLTREDGASFCSTLTFPGQGEHSVEVLARGPSGPEVAALFYVDVVTTPPAAAQGPEPEPTTLAEARRSVLERINALRSSNGLRPLELTEALSSVAQTYSERMAKEHFFAHVAPDGETLTLRLRRANFSYRRAGENLGLASGPLSAHSGIEQSPGHRRNLLEPDFEQLGVGVAAEQLPGRTQVVLTELLAAPTRLAEDAVAAVHRSLAKRRAQLRLPALERNAILDDLALERARELLALGTPEPDAPNSPLQKRVFASLADAQSTSMDLFLADAPTFIPESQGLRRKDNTRVGVGAVKGPDPSSHKGTEREKYWVVVIYTGSR